jgi:hypothetical protein
MQINRELGRKKTRLTNYLNKSTLLVKFILHFAPLPNLYHLRMQWQDMIVSCYILRSFHPTTLFRTADHVKL